MKFETCEWCTGQVKIIVEASNRYIEEPAVKERILAQLKNKAPSAEPVAPPAAFLWSFSA